MKGFDLFSSKLTYNVYDGEETSSSVFISKINNSVINGKKSVNNYDFS